MAALNPLFYCVINKRLSALRTLLNFVFFVVFRDFDRERDRDRDRDR